jgi:hypothetical protein
MKCQAQRTLSCASVCGLYIYSLHTIFGLSPRSLLLRHEKLK